MAADSSPLHFAMLPYLAFGHLLPFLELAKSLARRGHRVSFLTTTRNISRLPPPPPLVTFVPLPFPTVLGLPAAAESTSDVPPDLRPLLQTAFDALEPAFRKFVSGAAPDWVVHDFAAHWAHLAGIPCVLFNLFPASTSVFFGSQDVGSVQDDLTAVRKWVPFPTTVAYRGFEAAQIARDSLRSNASGISEGNRAWAAHNGSQVVAQRSSSEFEPEWFRVLVGLHDKPVIPVGLLPVDGRRDLLEGPSVALLLEWLDSQTPATVVYVALGSEATLPSELLRELALGLEASGLPFVWALREPAVRVLPDGFGSRTADRGMVVEGWAPQVAVLGHPAVGGFLTHCGWGSIIEGLQFGRPLVMLPLCGDQGPNARAMGERGFGVEVERAEEDGSFTREAVAAAVRKVLVGHEGEALREKAREVKVRVFEDQEGRQEKYMDEFVQFLRDKTSDRASLSLASKGLV